MKRPIGLLCAIGLLTFASTAWAQSPAPVMFPGTGHFYQLVFAGTMNFDAAKAYDGMVVEYDFENVPVPTLSGWLLAILTVLLLAGGYALLRHRRTANATS